MAKSHAFVLIALLLAGGGAWVAGVERPVHAAVAPQPAAVPVSAVPAKVEDVPVLLDGLGTVQALNTVQVKAQVNGTLVALPARQGQEVKAGDILAEIDPRPYQAVLDQAQAKLAGDQATLANDALNLRRDAALARNDFASRQQVDNDRAAQQTAQATIAADQAAIEAARLNLEFCTIRAPFDGRVGFYQTDVGNLIEVTTQTSILSLTQDRPIEVMFTLPEAQLSRVRQAMLHATLPVTAYAGDDTTPLAQGTLAAPNNAIDTSTGTIQYLAVFPNRDDALWPGEFVNVRLQVASLHDAVTVPLAAVQHGPGGRFVFTVQPDATVREQPVQVSYQNNAVAVIGTGLSGGQSVVLTGQSRLASGIRVAVEAAPAAAGDSASAGDASHG